VRGRVARWGIVVSLLASTACSHEASNKAPVTAPSGDSRPPNPPPAPSAPSNPAPSPAAKDPRVPADIKLTWKMERAGQWLRVLYHVDNLTKQRLYLSDTVLVATMDPTVFVRSTNIAIQALTDDTAQITLGVASGDVPGAMAPPGFYVPVEPGASFDGRRDLPLPLQHVDAMDRATPLPASITKASFVLQAFLGEPPAWRDVAGQDGKSIRIPEGFSPILLGGDAQPIP